MLRWIKKLIGIEKLEKENEELKFKLQEKQEHINKTNAYWKKQMHEIKAKKPNKKGL